MQRHALICALILAGLATANNVGLAGTGARRPSKPAGMTASNPHWIDISIRGLIATGVTHMTFDNSRVAGIAASHHFNLPRGAVITGFNVGVGPRNAPLRAADEFEMSNGSQSVGFATSLHGGGKQQLRPDIAVLSFVPSNVAWSSFDIALAAQPVGSSVRLEVVWQAPLTMLADELRLTLPADTTPVLAPPIAVSSNSDALGAAVVSTTLGGETVPAAKATFSATAAGLAAAQIELVIALRFANDQPRLVHHVQTVGGCTAHSLNAVWPNPNDMQAIAMAAITPRRMLLVVDGSKSMDAIGRTPVLTLIDHVVTQLATIAPNAMVQALVFDRSAALVLPGWSSNNRATQHALLSALRGRVARNGSDPSTAAALAAKELQTALTIDKSPIDIVWITDGAYSPMIDNNFAPLLDAKQLPPQTLRFHTLVVNQYQASNARSSTNTQAGVADLTAVKNVVGGLIRHVSLGMLGDDSATSPVVTIANQVAIGAIWTDFTSNPLFSTDFNKSDGAVVPGTAPTFAQYWSCPKTGRSTRIVDEHPTPRAKLDDRLAVLPEKLLPVPIAALVGADAPILQLPTGPNEQSDQRLLAQQARLRSAITLASSNHVLVALDTSTPAGRQRATALRAGMPYVQLTADQPMLMHLSNVTPVRVGVAITIAPVLAKETLQRIFRDQLMPRTRVCYQRALARSNPAALPQGTATYTLVMGRGEVIHAGVTGFTDAALTACLVEVGYSLDIPLPTDESNFDELIEARYPVTLLVQQDQATVVPGDAGSADAIDIERITPYQPKTTPPKIRVDAAKPLGGLAPSAPARP